MQKKIKRGAFQVRVKTEVRDDIKLSALRSGRKYGEFLEEVWAAAKKKGVVTELRDKKKLKKNEGI